MAGLDRAALDRYITNAPEPNVFRCAACGESSEDHEQFDFEDQGYDGSTWVCPEYVRLARAACKLADKLNSILSDLEDHVLEEPDEDAGHVCREHCPC
jgi:hypothetical protein